MFPALDWNGAACLFTDLHSTATHSLHCDVDYKRVDYKLVAYTDLNTQSERESTGTALELCEKRSTV